MNKLSFTMPKSLLLLAVGAASPLFIQPAEAQDTTGIRNGDLPKVHFYKARKRVRVENTAPIVTYDEPEEKEPIYLIPTGLRQPKGQKVIMLSGPGQDGGDGGGGGAGGGIKAPPGYMAIDPSRPPKSKFESNIPMRGMAPGRDLGNGTSTNLLAGKMWNPPKSPASTIAVPARAFSKTAPVMAVYKTPVSSGSASGSSSSTTSLQVNAVMKTRKGDLLKK